MTEQTVKVNSEACISCWVCVAICGKVFDFDDDRKSKVIKQPENEEEMGCAKEAIDACCVEAIYFEEAQENDESEESPEPKEAQK